MPLADYISRLDSQAPTLVLANRKRTTQPMAELVASMFEDQPVEVRIDDVSEVPPDHMVVLREGSVVATSSVDEFLDSVLFADAERFTSGSRPLADADLPDVVAALEETSFVFGGTSTANTQKLLFIAISRYIERLAFESPGGRLRTGFQHLSRMGDEQGTAAVYRTLGNADLDVHVYGVPDWIPPADFGVTVHGGYTPEFRENWFVIYEPPPELDDSPMALLSNRHGDHGWRGFWTTDEGIVSELAAYVSTHL